MRLEDAPYIHPLADGMTTQIGPRTRLWQDVPPSALVLGNPARVTAMAHRESR